MAERERNLGAGFLSGRAVDKVAGALFASGSAWVSDLNMKFIGDILKRDVCI
jgi:hypothetical protein